MAYFKQYPVCVVLTVGAEEAHDWEPSVWGGQGMYVSDWATTTNYHTPA